MITIFSYWKASTGSACSLIFFLHLVYPWWTWHIHHNYDHFPVASYYWEVLVSAGNEATLFSINVQRFCDCRDLYVYMCIQDWLSQLQDNHCTIYTATVLHTGIIWLTHSIQVAWHCMLALKLTYQTYIISFIKHISFLYHPIHSFLNSLQSAKSLWIF